MIDVRVGGRLLGRHVGRRAERDAGRRDPTPRARVAQGLGDAEVHHQRVPAREQHVVRLNVAVHHAVGVGVRQGVDDLHQDLHGVVDRQLAVPGQPVAQRLALDRRHDVIEESVGLTGVEQRQDVWVLELRDRLDLAREAVGAQRGGELGAQHLHRHLATVPHVFREIDRRHAARPELADQTIAVSQGRGDAVEGGRHAG